MSERRFSWMCYLPVPLTTPLFILQVIVGTHLLSEVSQIQILTYAGVGLYVFSGIIFGARPLFEFCKKRRDK